MASAPKISINPYRQHRCIRQEGSALTEEQHHGPTFPV